MGGLVSSSRRRRTTRSAGAAAANAEVSAYRVANIFSMAVASLNTSGNERRGRTTGSTTEVGGDDELSLLEAELDGSPKDDTATYGRDQRLKICGKIEKWPFWVNTLANDAGDQCRQATCFETVSSSGVRNEKASVPGFMQPYVNRTLKIFLTPLRTLTDDQRVNYPEHDILIKAVKYLCLSIEQEGRCGDAGCDHLSVTLFENHRNNWRRMTHRFRQLHARRVVSDMQNGRFVVKGDEFVLRLRSQPATAASAGATLASVAADERGERAAAALCGSYWRSLDTLPSARIAWECRAHDAPCCKPPVTATHSKVYASRLQAMQQQQQQHALQRQYQQSPPRQIQQHQQQQQKFTSKSDVGEKGEV